MRLALGMALLLALFAMPGASARAEVSPSPPCAAATDPACWAETHVCRVTVNATGRCLTNISTQMESGCVNHQIVVMVTIDGTNHYCHGEPCYNRGIIVFVGNTESCHGYGLVGVCIRSVCDFVPPIHAGKLDGSN